MRRSVLSDDDLNKMNRDPLRSSLMRERYLRNLGMFRICVQSYVPNLEVFMRSPTTAIRPLERVRAVRSVDAEDLCADDDELDEDDIRRPFFWRRIDSLICDKCICG